MLADETGIGSTAVTVCSPEHRRARFGYLIDPAHWGRGYATEVAGLVLGFARTTLGMHRVEATCHPENVGSQRVLEKVGLRQEGRMRDHLLVRGAWRDSLLYAAITTEGPDAAPRSDPTAPG